MVAGCGIAQPLPSFQKPEQNEEARELGQLPVLRRRDAGRSEAMCWDVSCQHPWWVAPLPQRSARNGHYLAAAMRREDNRPLSWLYAPAPMPSMGTPKPHALKPPSDALLPI